MKIIAVSFVLLCGVLCVSAQETPVVSALNEKRVALTEAAVALDASGAPALEVTYDNRLGAEDAEVPLDLFESMALLRRMPPTTGSWACFGGAAGDVVQVRWEDGRLW